MKRESVENFTSFLEFLADHINGTLGHLLIKASPLLAPLPSAIAVFHAVFARILFSYGNSSGVVIVAVIMAGIMTAVVEGIGFAAVNARDEIEAHNRKSISEEHLDASKAAHTVRAYFAITLGTIFMFESAPAMAEWWLGEIGFTSMIVHLAPLVFPFFSNIGASIYSLMDVLEKIRLAQDENNAQDAQIAQLSSQIEQLLSSQKSAQLRTGKLRNELADAQSKIEQYQSENEKLRSEIVEMRVQNAAQSAALNHAQSAAQLSSQIKQSKMSKKARQEALLEIAETEPLIAVSRLANRLGVARNTITNDLKALENNGTIHRNGNGIEIVR
jgi:flagellar biosynthesis GTPase FlhF